MNAASVQDALAEEEGDYEYWQETHGNFFNEELKNIKITFIPNVLVVYERFTTIYFKSKKCFNG